MTVLLAFNMCIFNIKKSGFSLAWVITLVGCGGLGSNDADPVTVIQVPPSSPFYNTYLLTQLLMA